MKRLYVRPTHRKAGIGHILMLHAHRHAAQHGLRQLILDVLPSRTHVIDFYRRLGYTETDPYPTESPVAMVYLQRPVWRTCSPGSPSCPVGRLQRPGPSLSAIGAG